MFQAPHMLAGLCPRRNQRQPKRQWQLYCDKCIVTTDGTEILHHLECPKVLWEYENLMNIAILVQDFVNQQSHQCHCNIVFVAASLANHWTQKLTCAWSDINRNCPTDCPCGFVTFWDVLRLFVSFCQVEVGEARHWAETIPIHPHVFALTCPKRLNQAKVSPKFVPWFASCLGGLRLLIGKCAALTHTFYLEMVRPTQNTESGVSSVCSNWCILHMTDCFCLRSCLAQNRSHHIPLYLLVCTSWCPHVRWWLLHLCCFSQFLLNVPGSKLIVGMVICRPTVSKESYSGYATPCRSLHSGYLHPYYWVYDHPLTHVQCISLWSRLRAVFHSQKSRDRRDESRNHAWLPLRSTLGGRPGLMH